MGGPGNWNAPIVGERLGVCLTPSDQPNRAIVSGQTYREPWTWERSPNGDAWAVMPGAGDGNNPPIYEYSPTTDDVNNYIRAKVKLTDGAFAYTRTLGGRERNKRRSHRCGNPICQGKHRPVCGDLNRSVQSLVS